ncbi:MAG: tetratricopeptide repeat protein [Myxococcota bacterium]
MRFVPGNQFGVYTLQHRLGAGGMAEVWAATHAVLKIQVALKILFHGHPAVQARLLREGRAQAAMDHPNILPVRDLISVNGAPGLVLPLIEGPSLDKVLALYRPTEPETVALIRAITAGVYHAHQKGMIHRDLKPGNVLLETRWGQIVPRVSDFGLVKITTEESQTRSGAMMGTLNYAAPEQILDARAVDHRADLFSLGVILVELLTGSRPFQGTSIRELLAVYQQGPDLQTIPPPWQGLCQSLLAVEPGHRLSDCGQLLSDLDEIHPPMPRTTLTIGGGLAQAIRRVWQGAPSLVPVPSTDATPTTPLVLRDNHVSESQTFNSSLFASALPPALSHHNLPAEMDAFIGRTPELEALAALLHAGRLVTLLGTAGTGKTRLALRYAHDALDGWPGGVWFCDLSDAHTAEDIAFIVSKVLDAPIEQHDPFIQIGHAIAGRGRCLMIFDNFEQLVDHSTETVMRWRSRAPDARFLITSRTLLGVPGEQILSLTPLQPADAVALFIARTQTKRPNLDFTIDEREDIADLVKLLDGLPLAIELAAARIRMMKPRIMIQRMNQRFQLLGATRQSRRQSTLRAAIDWSWNLLEGWAKRAFMQCSVFEGGFTLDAAESVLDLSAVEDDPDHPPPWPMDAIQSLVDRSLLMPLADNALGEPRFGMLLSLQDYAAEKLAASDPAIQDGCHRRHITVYAAYGRSASANLMGHADGTAWWWSLMAEYDNLVAGVQRAERLDTPIALAHLALAISEVVRRRGPYAVGLEILQRALRRLPSQRHPALAAALMVRLGIFYKNLGKLERAEQHYQAALQAWQTIGDPGGICDVLGGLGLLHLHRGQKKPAMLHLERALQIARQNRDGHQVANLLNSLGSVQYTRGQPAQAEALLQEALSTSRTHADRQTEGMVLSNLGNLYYSQGEIPRALRSYQQALIIHREVGNRSSEATALSNLGMSSYNAGAIEESYQYYQRALDIAKRVGDRNAQARALSSIATLMLEQSDLDAAEIRFEQALAIAQEDKRRFREAIVRYNLGRLYQQQNRLDDSWETLAHALKIAKRVKSPHLEGIVMGHMGMLCGLQGQRAEGRDLLIRGEQILDALNDQHNLGLLLCQRAAFEQRAGQPDAMARALKRVRQLTEALRLGPDAVLMKQLTALEANAS